MKSKIFVAVAFLVLLPLLALQVRTLAGMDADPERRETIAESTVPVPIPEPTPDPQTSNCCSGTSSSLDGCWKARANGMNCPGTWTGPFDSPGEAMSAALNDCAMSYTLERCPCPR